MVLTLGFANEILWCDHSNETSSPVLLYGATCFSLFYKMKFGIFYDLYSSLAAPGSKGLD